MSLSENGIDYSQLIPFDVIIMVFAKLPLKSIARCRCVSKLWASILRHSDFTELFLSRSSSRTPKLLFVIRNDSEIIIYSSPQPQNPDENSSLVVLNYQMKFAFHGYSHFVHGLICIEDWRIINGKEERELKICNPSTGQSLVLPKLINSIRWSLFWYDPICKQYKVLAMSTTKDRMCSEHQVLTLGSGNMSWRMIECGITHNPPLQKICINGVLYYTSIDLLTKTSLIVCFDVRSEKFTFIKTMETFNGAVLSGRIELINYNGKLGLLMFENKGRFFFFDGRSIRLELWVLEDLEKQEWSEHTLVFNVLPGKFFKCVFLELVGMTQTNEIVLSLDYGCPFYLFYLNLERKTIVRVEIEGIKAFLDEPLRIKQIFLNHVEDVKLY